MSKTEDTLKARFREACAERDAILKKAEPLHAKRDAILAKAREIEKTADCHSACNIDSLSRGIGVQN